MAQGALPLEALRLGVYGGTFDPIHNAHLRIAAACRERFHLDLVLLIPNKLPPHKRTRTGAEFAHRLAMARLAVQPHDGLAVSGVEDREGKSYTIQTLELLRTEYRDPVHYFFVIGADAFAEVLTWHRAEEVFRMTDFIVVSRPGFEYAIPPQARVHRLDGISLAENSTAIRAALAQGTPACQLEALPPSVAQYIDRHGLYRGAAADQPSADTGAPR
jgi:nicotinate-nucleotide adenylyltransferase